MNKTQGFVSLHFFSVSLVHLCEFILWLHNVLYSFACTNVCLKSKTGKYYLELITSIWLHTDVVSLSILNIKNTDNRYSRFYLNCQMPQITQEMHLFSSSTQFLKLCSVEVLVCLPDGKFVCETATMTTITP